MKQRILAIFSSFSILICFTAQAGTLEEMLNQRGISKANTSLIAAWADTGEVLAAWQEDLPLTPASVAKLVTTYCSLKELGEGYRFETQFFSPAPIQNGVLGNLLVRGEGDPSMVTESLEEIKAAFLRLGLKKIGGDIFVDDSFFDNGDYPGRQENNTRAYNAPTCATPFNFNTVAVEIGMEGKKVAVKTVPDVPYFELVNKIRRGGRRTRIYLKTDVKPDSETILASGNFAGRGKMKLYQSIHLPAKYFGHALAKGLQDVGVAFQGQIKRGFPEKMESQPVLVWRHLSKPLSFIVQDINKFSNNFMAEQVTKHLGAKRLQPPGTTAKGLKVYEKCLVAIGVEPSKIYLENGSGLSYDNKMSAKDLVRILLAGYRDEKIRSTFIASLSLHGVDGTMKGRRYKKELNGVLRAKTGSLNGISALAGFVPSADGRVVAFAILMNDLKRGLGESQRLQDTLVWEWSLSKRAPQ